MDNSDHESYNVNDGDDDDLIKLPKPFSFENVLIVISIITNLALLIVLLYRLVKDIRRQKTEKTRWARRHVLIVMCIVHVINLILNITYLNTKYSWYTYSVSACRAMRTFSLGFSAISLFYSVFLGLIILVQTFWPTFLVGEKQNKVWLLIHILIWSIVFIVHGIFTSLTYGLKVYDFSPRGKVVACEFTESMKIWIWYILGIQIFPVVALVLSAVIVVIGYLLKSSQNTQHTNPNCEMLNWVIRTQSQSIMFLVTFAIFTCCTCLPQAVTNMQTLSGMLSYTESALRLKKTFQFLYSMYYLLFPVCCLVLDETWLCAAIDKRFFKTGSSTCNTVVGKPDEDAQTQECHRLTAG